MRDELQEKIIWQNINSSKEKGKILIGKLIAIETETLYNTEIICAIIDFNGIKILIPATEMTTDATNDKKLIRNMMGANIKFIVVEIDKESKKAIGSRNKALQRLREIHIKKIENGDRVYSTVVGIWKKYLRLECLGIDFIVKAQDLQYGYVEDVSKIYKMNEQIKVLIKDIENDNENFKISVKDILEDPFKNIRKDFTERGEYLATITGYANDGIYANLKQGVDTICTLPTWLDRPPLIGEKVVIQVVKIIPEKRKIYSSLLRIVGGEE